MSVASHSSSWTRWQRLVVACAVLVAFAVLSVIMVFLLTVHHGLTDPEPSRLVVDRRGDFLVEAPGYKGRWGYWPMPYSMPRKILCATLATEDRNFYHHSGVYLPSVIRAAWQYISNGRVVSGASTIAMQVARLQHPAPRTIWNKLREMAEASLMVGQEGHERVLRQYLRIAPYGNRVRGAARAARYYFQKPVEDLSWLQAAFLAGLPQSPGRMNPYDPKGLERAMARARRILENLHRYGFINKDELENSFSSNLELLPRPSRPDFAMHAALKWSRLARKKPGLIQSASLDLKIQKKVKKIVQRAKKRLTWRGVGNIAALVLDRASMQVLAWVGSCDYFDEDPRGAMDFIRIRRPPGSALKPFIYALAMDAGLITAATELADIQVEFVRSRNVPYRPSNIGHGFLGPILARDALANSRNIPALEVMSRLGVDRALDFFSSAGVGRIRHEPGEYGLGLVLGNLPVNLEELAGLYGVLANRGKYIPLADFLGDDEKIPVPKTLISESTAELVANILADPEARLPTFKRGSALEFDYAVSVKTGTSQGYRDGWAVGFSDRLLVGVWVGNHDWRRMNRVGGMSAARILHRIMDKLMIDYRPFQPVAEQAPIPEGYVARTVCLASGLIAGAHCPHHRIEYFRPGTEPVQTCGYHREVALDRRNGLLATRDCPSRFVIKRNMLTLPERYSSWSRQGHIDVAPTRPSPLCAGGEFDHPFVSITEPKTGSRFIWDPDTPREFATLKIAAKVIPATQPVVFLVDDVPVAKADYPYEFRWSITPGRHTIRAAMLNTAHESLPVTITVDR